MRRGLLLRLMAFTALLIGLDLGISVVLLDLYARVRTSDDGGLIQVARTSQAEVVVLGSSRAVHHYDAPLLEQTLQMTVYNAGCDGQGTAYVRAATDLILQTYTPKMLLLNIDPGSLVPGRERLSRVVRLAPFYDESEVLRQLVNEGGAFHRLKFASRSFRFNGAPLMEILRNLIIDDVSYQGYAPLSRTMSLTTAREFVEWEPTVDQWGTQAITLALWRETIIQARRAGCAVVLVNSPRWRPDFTEAPHRTPLLKTIEEMASDCRVPYISIRQSNAAEFRDPSLFADQSHLNKQGAQVFTRLLGERLIALGSGRPAVEESKKELSGP